MREPTYPAGLKFGFWETLGGKERRGKKYYAEVKCTKCKIVKFIAMSHLKDGGSTQCRKCASSQFRGENNPCLVNIARGTSIVLVQKNTPNKNNSTGYRGVYKQRNKFKVMFTYQGVTYQRHGFDTPERAFDAYIALKKEVTSQDSDIITIAL